MERHSTPDQYSATIKRLRERRDAGLISYFVFAAAVRFIWEKRHGRA